MSGNEKGKEAPRMIPVGYMAKRVVARPEWLHAERVADIYSFSNCVSKAFADYLEFPCWRNNGWWFFDSPDVIRQVAQENSVNLTDTRLFFYEEYELHFDCDDEEPWTAFEPYASFKTEVVLPKTKTLEGFDVATCWGSAGPECSPLSCNSLAAGIETNKHCLLESFDRAKQLLKEGAFKKGEPGPYRIIAVYTTDWPWP